MTRCRQHLRGGIFGHLPVPGLINGSPVSVSNGWKADLSQALEHFAKRPTDGLDGISVIRVRRKTLSVEVGPFIHQSPPFDIGFTDELFQELIAREDEPAAFSQSNKWPINIVEQPLASLELTVQDAFQCPCSVDDVLAEPGPDFDFRLSLTRDG